MSRPQHVGHRTWLAHVPIVVGAVVAVYGMQQTRIELLIPTPLFVGAIVAAVFAGRTAFRLWTGLEHGWRLHARILAHVVPIGALTYLTGWGSALVPVQLIAVASNAKHGGYSTLRRTLAWASGVTLLLELGVEFAVIPSALSPAAAHVIAAVGCGAAVFIGSEFAHADRARRRAELDQAGLAADVLEEREKQQWLQDEIAWRAQHDPVTGLVKRSAFVASVQDRLRRGRSVDLLHVGIEGLSNLSEVHGSTLDHIVRREVANRVRGACAVDGAIVASLAPDTLGVLLPTDHATSEPTWATRLARTATAAIRLPIDAGTGPVHVTASIGVARATPPTTAETALFRAAVAFHAATLTSVDRVEAFDPIVHHDVADRLTLAADLRGAVVNQDFDLDFQPIVDLRSGRIVSAEVLVRWDHPVRGRLGPDRFIPEAERSGHIAQIGRYVLEEAAWQARAWQRDLGERAPSVAVNVSARQFDDHLIAVVEEVLDDTLLEPRRLTLELTETALAPGGSEVLRHYLHELKELGVTLALDDFGTGYSSLEHVQGLPLDVLKIDRVFVSGAVDRGRDLAGAIVSLARAMQLTTVVEGVETRSQAERFRELGCDRGQGFLFAEPLPIALLNHRLRHGEHLVRAR